MRWIKAAWEWLVDQFIGHWPAIVTVIVAGGGMSYLAAVSKWLSPYEPVAGGAIGIATAFLIALVYYLFGVGRVRHTYSNYLTQSARTAATNVLAPIHQHERIALATFYHPFYRPTLNARFENCELFGPVNIVPDGCQFISGRFNECEIVIIRGDRPIKGATVFRLCTFLNFQMYRVTMLMTIQTYHALPAEMRQWLPVISDGRIGDI